MMKITATMFATANAAATGEGAGWDWKAMTSSRTFICSQPNYMDIFEFQ